MQTERLGRWSEAWKQKIEKAKNVEELLDVVQKAGTVPGNKWGEDLSFQDIDWMMSDAEKTGVLVDLPRAGGFKEKAEKLLIAKKREEIRRNVV
jgi:hypothetical protein